MLKRIAVTLSAAIAILAVGQGVASAAPIANTYPYSGQQGVDPWNMDKGQCTSFVAWRLHEDGKDLTGVGDGQWNARDWDNQLAARGKRVDQRPAVGAVAQWEAGERTYYKGNKGMWYTAGSAGHVGYIAAVYSNGDVLLQDYNRLGDERYMTTRVPATFIADFIHV